LFLIVAYCYLYGLGHFPFVGPDEPRYAQVAREMFVRHDLITPTLGGRPWFEKPALLYWLMIASFKTFGVAEWTARLGPAICGLLTVTAVYWLGRRIAVASETESLAGLPGDQHPSPVGQSQVGIYSALVAASSGGLIAFSHAASFDVVITMSVTWALAFFFAAELSDTDRSRSWLLAAFYSFVGVSLLAKGLVGIVIPFGVIAAYFCLRLRLPERRIIISLLWGMPLALAVSAVWYGPVIARNGWPFIDQFFIQHHFARYLSNKYHHPQPLYFYLPVILLFSLPWTPFLIEGLLEVCKVRHWRQTEVAARSRVFFFAWLIVPLIFFSLAGSKLPGYVLPSLPAAALLAGERLAHFVRGGSKTLAMRSTGLGLLLLSIIGLIYAERVGNISLSTAVLVVSPIILAGLIALMLPRKRSLAALLVVLSVLASVILSLKFAAARFTERETVRALINSADQLGYGSAPLFMFEKVDRTAEFYAAGRVAYMPDGEPVRYELLSQIVNQVRQTRAPILILLRPRSVSQLASLKELKTTVIGTNGSTSLVAVESSGQ
jgi:4-amino-4-deoxy-L-arabinose transferase-like glycosyltransferase